MTTNALAIVLLVAAVILAAALVSLLGQIRRLATRVNFLNRDIQPLEQRLDELEQRWERAQAETEEIRGSLGSAARHGRARVEAPVRRALGVAAGIRAGLGRLTETNSHTTRRE